jgi:hypothetical protein
MDRQLTSVDMYDKPLRQMRNGIICRIWKKSLCYGQYTHDRPSGWYDFNDVGISKWMNSIDTNMNSSKGLDICHTSH